VFIPTGGKLLEVLLDRQSSTLPEILNSGQFRSWPRRTARDTDGVYVFLSWCQHFSAVKGCWSGRIQIPLFYLSAAVEILV